MKSRAAVLYGPNEPFKVEEIEVDPPKAGEVLVHLTATGLCHSDYHLVTGDMGPLRYPMIGGHEGAGIVQEVGPGVTRVKPGDHVILSFIPSCGQCRFCSMGLSMLCDRGAGILEGRQLDGTFRMRTASGDEAGQMSLISTFSEWTVCPADSCVVIDEDLPLDRVCLVGCGVPTGFGAAVNRADVRPGETVVVFGIGGVGINAVQGAVHAGAARVVAVDIRDSKLEAAESVGATHTINSSRDDPVAKVMELTNGVGADKSIVTIDVVTPEHIGTAFRSIRKAGRAVIVGVSPVEYQHVDIMPFELIMYAKELVGSLYGNSNPQADIPRYLGLYRAGKLKVDELITNTYTLDQINDGYRDMLDGKNVRGVVVY